MEYPDLSVKYSTPEWIVRQWTDEYGEETARKMLESQYKERPITVRVNLHRISRESLMERLVSEGVRVRKVEGIDCALEISGYDYLAALPSFREGLFQVQDVSSMLAVLKAAPRRGDYCIDVCAAPGGKSLHLADLLDGTGMVEARDLTEYKVQLIEENIARSGMTNIRAVQWDATVPDEVSCRKSGRGAGGSSLFGTWSIKQKTGSEIPHDAGTGKRTGASSAPDPGDGTAVCEAGRNAGLQYLYGTQRGK